MEQHENTDQTRTMFETHSQVSSSRSSKSSASAAATKAKAKAVLIEARYAAKEAQMMKEKARIKAENQKSKAEAAQLQAELEANLYMLKTEKSATAASAEAAVYEAAAAMEGDPLDGFNEIPLQDTAQRTSEFVQAHYAPDPQQEALVHRHPPVTSSKAPRAPSPSPPNQLQWYPLPNSEPKPHKPSIKEEVMVNTPDRAPTRYPPASTSYASSLRDYALEPALVTDVTKYLVRREMVSSGLLKFDDCPQNYWAWKTSFQEITRELSLTAREDLTC